LRVLEETRVNVRSDSDVVTARQVGRELASRLAFNSVELTYIATAISEIARNIVDYAGTGDLGIALVDDGTRRGVEIVATDQGPGIPDVPRVLRGGYSTGGSLGLGISGARRLMSEFHIKSKPGEGTRVTMRKWEPASIAQRARELV
jgi:serine/threonine-protein kinase RsbT